MMITSSGRAGPVTSVCALTLALAGALGRVAAANPPAAVATAAAAGAASAPVQGSAPAYRLGPGDQLEIAVPTHEGFNAAMTVQPDGRIYYPFVGEIMVTGLTIPELTEKIQTGLEKELKSPRVTISTREIRPGANRMTVTGAVRTQSAVELRENWRVSDAVAAAGGPTERADLKRGTFWHEGKPQTLDLSPLLVDGRVDLNPIASPGDVLIVPERARCTVSVTGEGARKQGSFEMEDPEPTVLKALDKAGGYTDRADLKHALIIRAGHAAEPLDLDALMLHGDTALNLALGNGDTIQVPALEEKVFVFGEVAKADAVPLRPGMRVLDAILATSPTQQANLDGAVLVRSQPDGLESSHPVGSQSKSPGGAPAAKPAHVTQLHLGQMKKGDLSVNVPLQSGDVILIPAKGKKLGIQDMLAILYPIDVLLKWTRLY